MAKKSEKGDKMAGGLPLSADCRVVMLIGHDELRRTERTNQLREMLEKTHGSVDVVRFDGEQANAPDVLDECRSLGLLAGHKMVLLDAADKLIRESVRPAFEKYAANPTQGATLVIRADSLATGNLGKAVEKIGAIIPCNPLSIDEAAAWVRDNSQARHGAGIDPDAAVLLVDRTGPELARLDMELGKLAVACGEGRRIDKALVESFVGRSREDEVWSIQSTVLTSPPSARLAQVRHMMDVNRTPAVMVMWALNDLARKIHSTARVIASGQNPFTMSYKLKLFGDAARPVIEVAKQLGPSRALSLVRLGVEADRRSKSGSDPDRELEIFVMRLPRVSR